MQNFRMARGYSRIYAIWGHATQMGHYFNEKSFHIGLFFRGKNLRYGSVFPKCSILGLPSNISKILDDEHPKMEKIGLYFEKNP